MANPCHSHKLLLSRFSKKFENKDVFLPVGQSELVALLPRGFLRRKIISGQTLRSEVQAIQPYRAGLVGPPVWRVRQRPAFPPCCCPLRLSPSGQTDDLKAFLLAPPACGRDSTRRFHGAPSRLIRLVPPPEGCRLPSMALPD